MAEIRLTLKSDLCAASGKGYAHTIDTDICRDEYGLPYIPARRLKGCLRDAAQYYGIDKQIIDRVFGTPGAEQPGALRLSNGYLADREKLVKEIRSAGQKPDSVLDLFTHIRAQTAIDPVSGTAKKESLRFTRVMNHYLPYGDNAEAVFVFPAECDPAFRNELETVCKALRGMGTHRSRGLGAISCRYIADASHTGNAAAKAEDGRLPLTVVLTDPLILAADDNNTSRKYIPGSVMLGALAEVYLREHSADDVFEKLFLNGEVRYSNFYITDAIGGRCEPAPRWLQKIKSANDPSVDGKLTTLFTAQDAAGAKPLRDVFAAPDMRPVSVKQETVYHHQHSGDKLLYTQTVITPSQCFAGEITGPQALLEILAALLNKYQLRIGRSRSAQYSGCQLVQNQYMKSTGKLSVSAGELVVFDLVSDVILTGAGGTETTDITELAAALLPGGGIDDRSACETKLVCGFNARRGMRNLPVAAFSMGGTLIMKASGNAEIPEYMYIGERQAEGFGEIHCRKAADIAGISIPDTPERKAETDIPCISNLLTGKASQAEDRQKALKRGFEIYRPSMATALTRAFIGRAMLMAEESADLTDLNKRAESVKDDTKRKALLDIIKQCSEEREWRTVMITVLRLCRYNAKEAGE